jgi:hypothetical protein
MAAGVMNVLQRMGTYCLPIVLVIASSSADVLAQKDSGAANAGTKETPAERDGQHDFDFNFGTWKTHVSRLLHPLTRIIHEK